MYMASHINKPPPPSSQRRNLTATTQTQNSILLHAPFTPFTVTFCHIIAGGAETETDLGLLRDFAATLGALRRLSPDLAKAHRLCDGFAGFAELYVRSKGSPLPHGRGSDAVQASVGSVQSLAGGMDGHLSSIGTVPRSTDSFLGAWTDEDGGLSESNVLDSWFYPHGSLMELLEHDLVNNFC